MDLHSVNLLSWDTGNKTQAVVHSLLVCRGAFQSAVWYPPEGTKGFNQGIRRVSGGGGEVGSFFIDATRGDVT
ncbi:MAG: hypothetical protein OYM47_02805 [Gemmatimonadota bacterium]|nr:hypothetical protein [Gemmatimonadota bacterium]